MSVKRLTFVLVGGSGYVGLRLAEQLLIRNKHNAKVHLADRAPPNPEAVQNLLSRVAAARHEAPAGPNGGDGSSSAPSECGSSFGSFSLSDDSCVALSSSGSADVEDTAAGAGATALHHDEEGEMLQFTAVDLRFPEALVNVCRGAHAVFHLASTGMSGEDSIQEAQCIFDVNVRGTTNVIAACMECGVPYLIYCSTCNVCFDWTDKIMLDEQAPYVDHRHFYDTYSVTKAFAEQLVLGSNGSPLFKQECAPHQTAQALRTCALRPPGIWGDGELRHVPRVISAARQGLLLITFGEEALSDWIHVDNLVDAMLLSLSSLESKDCQAAGQAYFVSDGAPPMNNFVFFSHFVKGLGYKMPTIRIPWRIVLGLSMTNEMLHMALLPLGLRLPLLLSVAEVYKTAVPHYFKIEKAQRELGYVPHTYNKAAAVSWYACRGYASPGQSAERTNCSSPSILLGQTSEQAPTGSIAWWYHTNTEATTLLQSSILALLSLFGVMGCVALLMSS